MRPSFTNFQSRGGLALPRLTLSLLTLCLGLFAVLGPAPEALLYDREAIGAGEFWRLVTGHLVHSDLRHLAWNLGAFLVLGGLLENRWRLGSGAYLASLALGVTLIDAWLWWGQPQLTVYCGLSGLLNGFFALLALGLWRATGQRLFLAFLVGDLGKIAWEWQQGGAILPTTGDAWVSVPGAHLAGLLAGVLIFGLLRRPSYPRLPQILESSDSGRSAKLRPWKTKHHRRPPSVIPGTTQGTATKRLAPPPASS